MEACFPQRIKRVAEPRTTRYRFSDVKSILRLGSCLIGLYTTCSLVAKSLVYCLSVVRLATRVLGLSVNDFIVSVP